MKNRILAAALLTAALAAAPTAHANTGELYGFGSRASGLGNTMMGGITGGFGTYYNPAANSAAPGMQISVGFAYMHPSFLAIHNITIANNATSSNPGDVVGNADTSSYLDFLGQVIASSLNLGEKWKDLTLGLTAFMPIARIAYLDSGDPFLPEYYNYRARTQRPQIFGSMSASPFKHFHIATGLAVAMNLSATVTAEFSGAGNSVSSARFASTIKPSVAPYFSIYVDPKPIEGGVTVRLPNTTKVSIDTTADARLLGPTTDLPLILNTSSSLFYDPLEIDAAVAYSFSDTNWATAELDWYQYKAFEAPSLNVTDQGSAFKVQSSTSTLPTMQNIFVPRAGFEHNFDVFTGRIGYSYRPSPVKDNSGPGNLVDPSQHIATLGAGFDLRKMKVTDKELHLDLHAQYHWLVHKSITKSPNNEAGTAGQTKVGSPGYDIGGSVWGGGLSLTMNF